MCCQTNENVTVVLSGLYDFFLQRTRWVSPDIHLSTQSSRLPQPMDSALPACGRQTVLSRLVCHHRSTAFLIRANPRGAYRSCTGTVISLRFPRSSNLPTSPPRRVRWTTFRRRHFRHCRSRLVCSPKAKRCLTFCLRRLRSCLPKNA